MDAAVVRFELHVPVSRSLKAKRAAIKPIVEGLRNRFHLSVAEVDHHDTWQRSAVAVAIVAADHRHVVEVLEAVERFVATAPDVDLIDTAITWLDVD